MFEKYTKFSKKRTQMNYPNNGYKIVLTADRTLMSEYGGGIFIGFSACIPHGIIPDKLYFSLFCPSVPVNKDGSAKYAPCGTRKIQAAFLNNGYPPNDVIVAHPEHLDQAHRVPIRLDGRR